MVAIGRLLRFKVTCLYMFFLFVSVYILGSLYWIFTQNQLSEATFLETAKCPACYGQSMCPDFLADKIERKGSLSQPRVFEVWNSKNVYRARHRDGKYSVVVKKLATKKELQAIDERICFQAKMAAGCDVTIAVAEMDIVKAGTKAALFSKHLQGTSPMFVCPSTRLIDRLVVNYKETIRQKIMLRDVIQIWFTSLVNPEPLLFQTFPASEGWPFPLYHGACGRYVVVGDGGRSLADFYSSPWQKRTDLSYQLLRIAELLTMNKDDFALYMTDVTYDNFAVDVSGKVTLVDARNVIAVDKRAVRAAKPAGWEDLHESTFTDCTGKTFLGCHSFSEMQLCSHMISDHNYYAVCRVILSKYAGETDGTRPDGLLHDMPDSAKDEWDLDYLLNECALPRRQRGRVQVVHKLLEALDSLRLNVTKAHAR